MIIKSIELKNFRNYEFLDLNVDKGINIFCGDNANGKTNLLEAVYIACTSKSQKSARDREIIKFDSDSAHIKMCLEKKGHPYRIDMHLKKNGPKGIALNGISLKRASELFGTANVIIFSPEDLNIVKNGPAERRKFIDVELCQLSRIYVHGLVSYNKVIDQKNRLLKNSAADNIDEDLLEIYNEQIIRYGSEIIGLREKFLKRLDIIIKNKHELISEGKEKIELKYDPNTTAESFRTDLERYSFQERKNMVSLVGPHKDDIRFEVNGRDLRRFGSQGQQRSAVLSLKLAEISIVEEMSGDKPALLLDDVLSELDRTRQTRLLGAITDIQTLITCTGLDDFINNRFHIDKIFYVKDGKITGEN